MVETTAPGAVLGDIFPAGTTPVFVWEDTDGDGTVTGQ